MFITRGHLPIFFSRGMLYFLRDTYAEFMKLLNSSVEEGSDLEDLLRELFR